MNKQDVYNVEVVIDCYLQLVLLYTLIILLDVYKISWDNSRH